MTLVVKKEKREGTQDTIFSVQKVDVFRVQRKPFHIDLDAQIVYSKEKSMPLPEVDNINPTHYKSHPSGIECITITRHFSFNLGNAIKYIWRCGLKNSNTALEDLKKAKWYIEDEIAWMEGAKK